MNIFEQVMDCDVLTEKLEFLVRYFLPHVHSNLPYCVILTAYLQINAHDGRFLGYILTYAA